MQDSIFYPKTIHEDWSQFLSSEINGLLLNIEDALKDEIKNKRITPRKDLVLRFLSLPLKKAKAIILGQDPYPQEAVATGRAFEVATLVSWGEPFKNVSLRNVVRAIYAADTGEYLTFNEIKQQILKGWHIAMPNEIFKSWEMQGVLLLNTSFTCSIGKPGSHAEFWQEFTQKLLAYINEKNPELFWLLWGNHAHKITEELELKNAIRTMHPMMCAQKDNRPTDFLFGKVNCFKETAHVINWQGENKSRIFFG